MTGVTVGVTVAESLEPKSPAEVAVTAKAGKAAPVSTFTSAAPAAVRVTSPVEALIA